MAGLLDDPGTAPAQPMPPNGSGEAPAQSSPPGPMPPNDPAATDGAAGESTKVDAQASERIRDQLLSRVPPEIVPAAKKIALAGKKVMFDETTHAMALEELQSIEGQDDAERIAKAIAGLMSLLEKQTETVLPPEAMIAASAILMCEAINFLSEGGMIQETPALVAATTKSLMQFMTQKYRIDDSVIGKIRAMGEEQQAKQNGQAAPNAAPARGGALLQDGLQGGQ